MGTTTSATDNPSRVAKTGKVTELAEKFSQSQAAVITEYRGLSVAALTQLRESLGADTTYAITKNSLTKLAAQQAGIDGLDEVLSGPTAVAFVGADPVAAAKSIRDFAKDAPALVIKGGVLSGKFVSKDQIIKLADLEPREVLLAKLAGAMKGNLAKAAGLFQAPAAQVARLAAALQEKKSA